MKKSIAIFIFLAFQFAGNAQAKLQSVNAVLQDRSYEEMFGHAPASGENATLRIVVHLQYVQQLLRQADTKHLTGEQQERRRTIIDLLQQYTDAAVFPLNEDYPDEWRPCFIDRKGNICAVGYLIEKTEGRDIAVAINRKHQYDFIADMKEDMITEWASRYGLTLEECAMIQPAYPPGSPLNPTQPQLVSDGYKISSGVLGLTNISFSVINGVRINKGYKNKFLPVAGLITGTAQMILGVSKAAERYVVNWDKTEKHIYSYSNIAAGAASILTGTLNLVLNKNNKERPAAFSMYSCPNRANSLTVGFSLVKRI